MFGALLIGIGTLAGEIGSSIGKYTVSHRREHIFTTGFVSNLAGLLGILAIGIFVPAHFFAPNFPGGFLFTAASLPTLIPRILLEIAQAHITLLALVRADRSTFAFLRILTIPLLLGADILLGYTLSPLQMAGVACIVVGLMYLYRNHGIKKRGAFLVLFTAVNAALTISLFKYDIAHFNSVEAEQSIVLCAILLYVFTMARINKENMWRHLRHPALLSQFTLGAIGNAAFSFAYLFLPPSIATAGKRALSSLWALGAGTWYFEEKRVFVKIITLGIVIGGLVLLAL